ncbi:MAG: 3-hydroxyacyl-ACP dehydratase FabZ [Spirochaetales bacterium]|nr:3-hydroxyacyl-ACP dehydratase FabZ [Spirochaetales bacterium]
MSEEIKKLIPHRSPFLFVDSVEINKDESITGYRTFTPEDFFFEGHFPEYPVVPGVILVETMAQCGGAGISKSGAIGEDKLFFLATIEKAKFRRQVRPNERVRIEVQNLRVSGTMLKQSGKAYVGDELAAEASWMCMVGSSDNL